MHPRTLWLLLLLLTGRLHAQVGPLTLLTPGQVREDILFTARTIESMHPNAFHSSTRKQFYRLRDSLIESVSSSMEPTDTWPLIARLCAAVNEGHTHAWYSDYFGKHLLEGRFGLFPLTIAQVSPAGLIVREDLSDESSLKAGDRITSINGRPVADLYAWFISLYGGLPAWRHKRINDDAIGLLHHAGIRSPYRIRYLQEGQEKEKELRSISYPVFNERRDRARSVIKSLKAPAYAFRRLPGNLALLEFNSMEGDPKAFDRFLEDSFKTFRERPIEGLIVDLRKNGGGNSVFGWYLLQYIAHKPFNMSGGTLWKVSPEGRKFFAEADSATRARLDSARWARYLAKRDGYIFRSKAGKPDPLADNPYRYTGKVAVLIGACTFSSANMTANTIQDFQLATLIGEPTGEPANDYGEVLYFETPHGKVPCGSSSKMFVRANGDVRDKNPVLPDILVRQDPDSKEDQVLEAARKWMRGK